MIKRVHKLWWAWDFDKEEAWYNEMAAQGLNLIHIMPFTYLFESGTPGQYLYRQELLDHLPSHPESEAYLQFMEETGAGLVCTYYRWAVFRRKAEEGEFDLFSDLESRIRHLKRVNTLMVTLTIANILAGLNNVFLLFTAHSTVNFWLGICSLIFSVLIIIGMSRVRKAIKRLIKERNIRE